MNKADLKIIVQSVLVEHFNIVSKPTMWSTTLENLNENFRFLGSLLELEQLLWTRLQKRILLIEHISTAIHTPEDLVALIEKYY